MLRGTFLEPRRTAAVNDLSIIDGFMDAFVRYIDSGFGLLGPDVGFLTRVLIGIDITLAGLFWALGGEQDVIGRFLLKILYIGAFAFILNSFSTLADIVFKSFAAAGLTAGGGALSDWLVRRGWHTARARKALMLLAACLMPLANVAVRTESAWLAVALIAVLLAAQSCWMANQLTLISESVPRESVASLLSLSALGGSLGGMLSTLGTGRLIAAYGYVPVFTALSVLHLTAFGCLLVAMRRRPTSPAAP